MILTRAAVIGACLMLVYSDVVAAQGGVADSVLKATGHWLDSADARSGLRWPAGCLTYPIFRTPRQRSPSCQVSDIPAPTRSDTARALSFRHRPRVAVRARWSAEAGRERRRRRQHSLPIVVGDWHRLIEAHRMSGQKDVGFVLASADVAGSSHADFALRCRKGVLEASLDARQSLGRGHSHAVAVRLWTRSTPDATLAARPRQHDAGRRRGPARRSRVRSHVGRLLPSRARGGATPSFPALRLRIRSGRGPGGRRAARERMQRDERRTMSARSRTASG